MKTVPAAFALLLAAAVTFWALGPGRVRPAVNPDPNHTHADFAVWIQGKQIDFSGEKFMSGSSTDLTYKEAKDKYLHLHDGNGRVIHRHKPGLTLGEFFASIGFGIGQGKDGFCWFEGKTFKECAGGKLRLYVNGKEVPGNPADYAFADTDSVLLTDSQAEADVTYQMNLLSDDACLYSRTCPERGDPPTENCIADPEVPCTM